MTITRVIRDGVEFFTVNETGESGMSQSTLARICGVSQQGVNRLLHRMAAAASSEHDGVGQNNEIWLRPRILSGLKDSKVTNLCIVKAAACAAIIEHYAFNSNHRTAEALFTYRKFGTVGITAWIQEITCWQGTPDLKSGIFIDAETLEIMSQNKIDASTYRLYFYLQRALHLQIQPKTIDLLRDNKISLSTLNASIRNIRKFQLIPDLHRAKRRRQIEWEVRDRLQSQIGGQTEAPNPWGVIDLLTDTEIIEIKFVHQWKEAFGHLLPKSETLPQHQKRLHLFGVIDTNINRISEYCSQYDVHVTFEKVEIPRLKRSREISK
jgi:hypothetical protein